MSERLSALKSQILSLKAPIVGLGIAALVLLPRLLTLGRFITSDEPLWIVRSISFLGGLLTGDLSATLQTGHPGVTTMWAGSLGLLLDYLLHHRDLGSLLAYVQSLPFDSMRVDPSLMPWVRLPIALVSSLCVWCVYRLARPMGQRVALMGAMLLGLHPLFLAHSRVLHHDVLVSVFISISIMAWLARLYYLRSSEQRQAWGDWSLTVASGVAAGLAFLSKSTAYVLIPLVMLILLVEVIRGRLPLLAAVRLGLTWLALAGITFAVLWPALWVDPAAVFSTVFGWISQSADLESASETASLGWNGGVPDLGILFYPVNWLLRTTPLTLVGLLAFPWWWLWARKNSASAGARWWAGWLVVWSLLFTVALSLGDKRDARYLLPIYFALCLLAALGLSRIFTIKSRISGSILRLAFVVLLLGFSLPYHPYYLAYYNPLLGGTWIAPRLTKVGWGEGMERAAAYLNQQTNAERLVVATSYAQNFLPYFAGGVVKHHQSEPSDYVLNYIRQIQNGYPYPEYWQYYQARQPVYHLRLAGIDYLWLHRESSLQPVRDVHFEGKLQLMGFTLGQRLVAPGDTLEVTFVWRLPDASFPRAMVHVQLIDEKGVIWGEAPTAPVLDPAGPSPVEGHYRLSVSPESPRFDGRLRVSVVKPDGQSSGQFVFGYVPVRHTSLPTSAVALPMVNLEDQISLLGYQVSDTALEPRQPVDVTLYWQAQTHITFDYTVFVQLLDANGEIWGQHDAQPVAGQLPTAQWTVGEVVTDLHSFTVAPDAPPGDYRLLVGMYRWDTGERLSVIGDATGQNAVLLSTVRMRTR